MKSAVLFEDTCFTVRPDYDEPGHHIIQKESSEGNLNFARVTHVDSMISILDSYGYYDSKETSLINVGYDFSTVTGKYGKSFNIKSVNLFSWAGPSMMIEVKPNGDDHQGFFLRIGKKSFFSRSAYAEVVDMERPVSLAINEALFEVQGGKMGSLNVKKGTPLAMIPFILATWRAYLRSLRILFSYLFLLDAFVIFFLTYMTILTDNNVYFGFLVAVHFLYVVVTFALLI